MSNIVFKESDIQTYKLIELQGKHVEVVSIGITQEGLLMYLRDLKNNNIYVVGVDQEHIGLHENIKHSFVNEIEGINNQERLLNILKSEIVHKLKKKYGKYKGYSIVDLAFSFMTMTNDDFFKVYGFNYVPEMKLQDEVKSLLYENINSATNMKIDNKSASSITSIRMNENISVQAYEQIKQQIIESLNSEKNQCMNVFNIPKENKAWKK